ncbi:MAG: hypothetical protein ABJA57_05300 [Ginsengibacter sp.]
MKNIFLFAGTLVFFFSCQIPGNKKGDAEKLGYELTKEELHAQEKKNPLNFLIVDGQNKHNLIGQMVIKGSITNKASVATFKDVDLKLSFYSKTGAMLESDKETIYEVISPGASKNFKTKYFAPKGADSVAFEILSAKSVE